MDAKRRTSTALRWARSSQTDLASDHFWHLPEFIEWFGKRPAVLYGRVSLVRQARSEKLDYLMGSLRRGVAPHGLTVIGAFGEVTKGWRPLDERPQLLAAIELAAQHGGIVIAPSSTRLLRHEDFHAWDNPDELPTVKQYLELCRLAGGVEFCTVLPPDLGWRHVKRHEIRRGRQATGRRGGGDHRPGWKVRRRERLLPVVRELREQGVSMRKISEQTDVPTMTLCRWLKR